jgi:hypothetical protein
LTPWRRDTHVDGVEVRPVGASTDGGIAHRVDDALRELGFGRE